MRTVWVLVKNNIKSLTSKSPAFLIMFILLPVIISVGISMLIPSTRIMNGVVINHSGTVLAEKFIEDLNQNACLELSMNDTVNMKDEIKLGNYNFGIIINEGFDEAVSKYDYADAIEIYCRNSEGYVSLLEQTISTELSNFTYLINMDTTDTLTQIDTYLNSKYQISMINMDDSANDYTTTNMLFSFIIMFAFLRAMTGASLVTKDRELGVYTRMLMTDATLHQYYIANILSSVLLVLVQNIAALGLISLCSDIVFGGTILEILIVLLVLSIMAVVLGDFFVVCTENKEVSNILSTFVAIILLMTGIVPKEMLPRTAVIISSVIPTRWAVNCLENMQAGESLFDSSIYLVMMILCSAALFAAIMIIVKRKYKKN